MNTPHETPYQTPSSQSVSSPISGGKKRLKSVNPVRAGLVLGVLYSVLIFIAMLIIIPFGLTGLFSGRSSIGGAEAAGMGIGMLILGPIIYGVVGFIGGVISAWVYNLVAKLTGGLEFTLEDVQ